MGKLGRPATAESCFLRVYNWVKNKNYTAYIFRIYLGEGMISVRVLGVGIGTGRLQRREGSGERRKRVRKKE